MFRADSASACFREETSADHVWRLPSPARSLLERKERGGYYTNPIVADFLVHWAVRRPEDTVLEPCFGGGVFLEAAIQRLRELGAPSLSLTGVEQDPTAYATTSAGLETKGMPPPDLIQADFFSVDRHRIGHHTVVVGNPPFIRYQRFTGEQRNRALARAAEHGVRFTKLTSAWAPFIVHATSFLKPGGHFAMVAPAELCHAAYARPVLRFLAARFERVRILTFTRKIFPRLNEDTVLILGESYGRCGDDLRLIALPDAEALRDHNILDHQSSTRIETHARVARPERFAKYLLPSKVRDLYEELGRHSEIVRFGAMASIGIGYVTGNNEFFHLTADESRAREIPGRLLRRAVCRASWLPGTRFTADDWNNLHRSNLRTQLLALPAQTTLPECVRAYLEVGRRQGVHRAYKCRVRNPWWSVPGVHQAEMLLTYMANERSLLVINEADAVAPNTLLCVRRAVHAPRPESFVAAWWTSISTLSSEIEGHSLGGGMLKLEPGEAVHVLLPIPAQLRAEKIRDVVDELDRLVRGGAHSVAIDLADRHILSDGLGLGQRERQLLRDGARALAERRRRR